MKKPSLIESVVIPETDPATNPHWHLSTAQHAAQFDREHATQPREEWTAADLETWWNLHLAT